LKEEKGLITLVWEKDCIDNKIPKVKITLLIV